MDRYVWTVKIMGEQGQVSVVAEDVRVAIDLGLHEWTQRLSRGVVEAYEVAWVTRSQRISAVQA